LYYFKGYLPSLNYIDELTIIGYGFGDIHINRILKDWLELTSERRITIINPEQEEIPIFMRHLYSQITIQKIKSMEYFSSLVSGMSREDTDSIVTN